MPAEPSSTDAWHTRLGFTTPSSSSSSNTTKPISMQKWAALSLLALPTVALLVPGYRVYRLSRAARGASAASPPPIRTAMSKAGKKPFPPPVTKSTSPSPSSSSSSTPPPPPRRLSPSLPPPRRVPSSASATPLPLVHPPTSPAPPQANGDDDAGAKDPLYAAGAFGIATVLVGTGLLACVTCVKSLLDVKNVDEFAIRMRCLIRKHIPQLSEALHKNQADPDDSASAPHSYSCPSPTDAPAWDAQASEARLRDAFERGGIEAWMDCALRELEAERRLTIEEAAREGSQQ